MKKFKWMMILLLAVIMLLPGCSSTKEIKVTGKEECKKLVDEFYAGLTEADPVRMTTTYNGEVTSTFTKDGEKMLIEDSAYGYPFYLFKENGKTYYMAEGEKPMGEDFAYEMYANSVQMNLTMFGTGIYNAEDTEDLQFNVTRTDKTDGTSELVSVVKGDTENGAVEITSTGVKADGKVSKITVQMKSSESTTEFVYDFEYDATVDLPEHEIKDMSQYYHHIDSPYATVEDVITALGNEEDLYYLVYGDTILVLLEENGRQLQMIAPFAEADYEAYDALDFMADDYNQKALEIVRKQTITDCVDYTDALVPQEELDGYVGQKGTALLENGFEGTGYGIMEDKGVLTFAKDGFEYNVEIKVPENFDFDVEHEFDDFTDCEILSIKYETPGFDVLPMQ